MPPTNKRLARPSLRGLLGTRRGALTLAILCGLAATAVIVFALGKFQNSVVQTAKQDTVLVATAEIPKGASADLIASQRLYKVLPVLATQVAPGAIVDAGTLSGMVAASNILAGQQLTSADFTAAVSGVTGQLTPNERAVAVTLDPTHAVANVLKAGDHVDVYASLSSAPGVTGPVVSLLVADATILQAPASSDSSGGGGVVPASGGGAGPTLLLGVSEQVSPKVMWVFDYGKVWLELRGSNASNPQPEITGLAQILLGNHLATTPTYATATSTGVKR
jgi:Flp pilus assembly protein CpaB